jgi:hypothetical protein
MTHGTPRTTVFLAFLTLLLSSATFTAQSATSSHTLTFAELTYGTSITAMAADGHGAIWFAGNTCSKTLPTTAGAVQRAPSADCGPSSSSTGQDGFVGRMDANGAVTYLSYLGGSGIDRVSSLALDAAGDVFVAGFTYSPDFVTTANAYDRSCGGDGTCTITRFSGSAGRVTTLPASDGFVTKLSPSGDRILYSTYIGGSDGDSISGIAVDGAGQVHLAGQTISQDFPVTAGALQTAKAGGTDPDGDPLPDGFYARLAANGASLAHGSYLGGSDTDYATGVTVDAGNNGYVIGVTSSRDFPVLNAVQPTHTSTQPTSSDAFVARFGAAGAAYSTYLGGSDTDRGMAVALTNGGLFAAGETCSTDFPAAPSSNQQCSAFISRLTPSTGAANQTFLMQAAPGDAWINALAVDANQMVYAAGLVEQFSTVTFPTTADAYQRSFGGGHIDAFVAMVDMSGETPALQYSTYLGGTDDEEALAVAPDGSGGVFAGGDDRVLNGGASTFPSRTAQAQPPREASPNQYQAFAAHVALDQGATGGTTGSDIVLYARDASIAGDWQFVADATAAGGTAIWNPDRGVAKIGTAAAAPANDFELTFTAQANVPYHLWLRMKAQNDFWQNDSVFVQFSDSVDAGGHPVWRIGSADATIVSLEDCTGCGEHGWGWNDNGYDTAGTLVQFATSGSHTIRVQQREDGISIDQVVLSSRAWLNAAPGTNKDDATIVPQAAPPPNPKEIVLYAAHDAAPADQDWVVTTDATAAGGALLLNPDRGRAKSASPSASGQDYFEITFSAQANTAYHLWVRSRAKDDSYMNDSVLVQFSGTVDASGTPIFRIGTDNATNVILEDCGGCGEQGWGWQDNAYGSFAPPVYFATTGPQTIRVLRREDGISIDQIVLSAEKYLNASPGQVRNDSTIVPR